MTGSSRRTRGLSGRLPARSCAATRHSGGATSLRAEGSLARWQAWLTRETRLRPRKSSPSVAPSLDECSYPASWTQIFVTQIEFYCAVKGTVADRIWPALPDIVDGLIMRFDRYMAGTRAKANDTPLNRMRAQILAHIRSGASSERGLFTLTVPTGGAKTLSSLALALEHAKRHRLDRIIYAIPFTSIIDQTATLC